MFIVSSKLFKRMDDNNLINLRKKMVESSQKIISDQTEEFKGT